MTATAVRTPEARPRKTDKSSKDTKVSDRSDVPEQIPGRKDSENANRTTSTMSLLEFRKNRPALFWVKGEKKEIKAEETIKFPSNHGFPLIWRDTVTKRGESKAIVQAAACKNKDGVEEYLAVKVVSFDTSDARDKADEEVKTLKNICHNHIIAFVGSYTLDDTLGILLFPLAKYNLWTYMKTICKHNRTQQGEDITPHKYVARLKGYFACLCHALLYLHEREKPIKHRDIKPENILIDAFGTVILTDFDISKEYRSREAAVTSGKTMCTVKYAPKETLSGRNRDLDSDIFSLGCVFLEMATVMLGESFTNLYDHISGQTPNGGQTPDIYVVYCEKSTEVNSWIEILKVRMKKGTKGAAASASGFKALDENSLKMILNMMSEKPKERPRLREVIKEFEQLGEKCVNCHPAEPDSNLERTSPSEEREAQFQESRSGATTQEKTTKPARVNSLPSPQLETVQETESRVPDENPSTDSMRLPNGRADLDSEPSSPRRITTEGSGKSTKAICVQETQVPQTNPHHDQNIDATPPPSTLNYGGGLGIHSVESRDRVLPRKRTSNSRTPSTIIAEPPPMSRNTSKNPRSRNIRIHSTQKKQKGTKTVSEIDEIPGKQVIVYNPETDEYAVKKKHDINYDEGILVLLPHGDGWKYRTLTGDLNLWKSLRFKVNLKRCFGLIRVMLLKGTYPPNMLLKEAE